MSVAAMAASLFFLMLMRRRRSTRRLTRIKTPSSTTARRTPRSALTFVQATRKRSTSLKIISTRSSMLKPRIVIRGRRRSSIPRIVCFGAAENFSMPISARWQTSRRSSATSARRGSTCTRRPTLPRTSSAPSRATASDTAPSLINSRRRSCIPSWKCSPRWRGAVSTTCSSIGITSTSRTNSPKRTDASFWISACLASGGPSSPRS